MSEIHTVCTLFKNKDQLVSVEYSYEDALRMIALRIKHFAEMPNVIQGFIVVTGNATVEYYNNLGELVHSNAAIYWRQS